MQRLSPAVRENEKRANRRGGLRPRLFPDGSVRETDSVARSLLLACAASDLSLAWEGETMHVRATSVLAVLICLGCSTSALGQVQTADITGRVTDHTGAVLPGATITLTGPALIQPQTSVTSETGTYQFSNIPIGTYTVAFTLPGFRSVVREGVQLTIGFTAQINQVLEISTVQETVTVSGESPIVDTKSTTARTTFDLDTLQNIPSARDPWVMLERVPNITMDRINVGGSQSGQQSGYISRGSGSGNNKWSLDGVDITDMSAVGASPIYYDFDMIQEMQVITGGADASQQTGGVGINFVSRSGTNRFSGSARLYNTNDRFQSNNVTEPIRDQGAGSGNPIQNINDTGFEVGGPLFRDKLWYWGSYGRQDIKVGVINFYEDTDPCQAVEEDPRAFPIAEVNDCLATDRTLLNNYNWKATLAPFTNNKFNLQNTWAEKVRNARDASDTRPIETAYRQKAVDSTFGSFGWLTGPSPIWKASDQHVFTDRFLMDVQYGHVGNNFTLTFQDPAQRDIQPTFDIPTGVWGRSYQESIFIRPTDSVDVSAGYFLPNRIGGDHAFKVGYRWRTARAESINHRGGNAIARFRRGIADSADLYRDGYTNYRLKTHALYAQDTFSVQRFTLNLGVRWDYQTDEALASIVPANPLVPNIMPAIDFPGVDPGVAYSDVSPRLGLTYDLFGTGRSVLKTSYSMYFGQLNTGGLAGELVSIGAVFVRYPWADLNNDTVVQSGELTIVPNPVKSGSFDPDFPTSFRSPGTIDANLRNDRTQEFIAGTQHELAPNLGVDLNYIWRRYDRFAWSPRLNFSSADFTGHTISPACEGCGTVSYFVATKPQPSPYLTTNQPDRYRNYNGLEVALSKRYASRWMGNMSVAFNNAIDYWDSAAAFQDPTNIANLNGHEYAPESGGSGLDSVFTNAKWLFKANGMYSLPLRVNVAGNLQWRQGYPFPQAIQITNRGNGLGNTNVLVEPMGSTRLPNVTVLDFRVDRPFQIGGTRFIPSIDIFNLTNANTIQSRRRTIYTYNHATGAGSVPGNANDVSSIISPRVIRFGIRVTW